MNADCSRGCGFETEVVRAIRIEETKDMESTELHQGEFGSCCADLAECMRQPNSLIRVGETGTLFLSIGYLITDEGTGWFDHAVIFCPFCGKQLQDRAEIAERAAAD